MSTQKCSWCLGKDLYEAYHDVEWGVPVFDDVKLFEALILESFQSGLSWWTILQKRENFRKAFAHFQPETIAQFDQQKIEQLLTNKGIVRHRAKIEACVSNAQAFLKLQQEVGSFSDYLWKYVNHVPLQPNFKTLNELPSATELSRKISADLKKRGFKFLGPTTVYSFMQGIGMTNDHLVSCFRHVELSFTNT